eukprot:COSAG04_NODE_169_length_21636_cov_32.919023_11_plen_136_part_00
MGVCFTPGAETGGLGGLAAAIFEKFCRSGEWARRQACTAVRPGMAAHQRRLRALSRALPAPSRRPHPLAAGAPPLAAQAASAVAGQQPPPADPNPTAMSDEEAFLFDCHGYVSSATAVVYLPLPQLAEVASANSW